MGWNWTGTLGGLGVALGLFGAATGAQAAEVTIALSSPPGFYFMQHFIAEGAGFYKEEGVEPVDVDVQDGPRQAAAILGGSALLAPVSFQHVIESSSRGGTLIAVAMADYNYPWSLVLSKTAVEKFKVTTPMALKDMNKLAGAKIGVTSPGSSTDQFIRFLLRSQGIDPDKTVQLMPVAPGAGMLAAMERGSIDGFIWGSPFPEQAKKSGLGVIAVDGGSGQVKDLDGFPYLVWATSQDALAQKRDLLFKALRALAKASVYAHQNPEKARPIMRAKFPKMSDEEFNAAFDSYLRDVPADISIGQQQIDKNLSVLQTAAGTPHTNNVKTDAVISPLGKEAQASISKP